MRLPIDTSGLALFSTGPAEPAVDFDTGRPKVGRDGQPIFTVGIAAMGDASEMIAVKVAGEPRGLGRATPVKITGLVAFDWTMENRHGISYTAERIEPLTAPKGALTSAS